MKLLGILRGFNYLLSLFGIVIGFFQIFWCYHIVHPDSGFPHRNDVVNILRYRTDSPILMFANELARKFQLSNQHRWVDNETLLGFRLKFLKDNQAQGWNFWRTIKHKELRYFGRGKFKQAKRKNTQLLHIFTCVSTRFTGFSQKWLLQEKKHLEEHKVD